MDSLVQQCLDILKRDDIKYELRSFMSQIIHLVMVELNPYIYIIVSLILLIFVLILAILVLLIFVLRNKNLVTKLF